MSVISLCYSAVILLAAFKKTLIYSIKFYYKVNESTLASANPQRIGSDIANSQCSKTKHLANILQLNSGICLPRYFSIACIFLL